MSKKAMIILLHKLTRTDPMLSTHQVHLRSTQVRVTRINCQVKSDVQPESDAKVTLSVLYLPANVSQLYSSLSLVAAFIETS